jgi:hypothetical protein
MPVGRSVSSDPVFQMHGGRIEVVVTSTNASQSPKIASGTNILRGRSIARQDSCLQ